MSLVLLLRSMSAAVCFFFAFASAASAHLLVPLAPSGHVFVVEVKAGTPPQPLSLLLSPSSPHTWLPKAEGMPCKTGYDTFTGFHSPDDDSGSACSWGSFSDSESSTSRLAQQIYLDFVVAYTDVIHVSGINITDTLTLGDAELDSFSMGLVDSTSNQQWIGMLGLGNDATTTYPRPSSKYRPNLVDRLVSDGKIASQAYSIWLDNIEGTSGALLLGAIDTSRYEGDLTRLNAAVEPYDVFPSAFRVSLASVEMDDAPNEGFQFNEASSMVVSISPAEAFSYLPDGLAEGIIAATGATWNTTLSRATIPCDTGSKNPKTDLRFQLEGPDGPVLHARLADLVIPQEVSRWEIAYETSADLNRNTCLFGIQKYPALRANDKALQYNLGSSLLRRTYMVFDAANKEVALAPAKFGAAETTSSIVAFEGPGGVIPSSRLYCAGESCPEPTGVSELGDLEPVPSSSNDNWKKIVIGVVVPVGILAILAPLVYILVLRRRKQQRLEKLGSVGAKDSDVDEDSFREDEFGVKVTVSVSAKVSKVSVAKPPPSPQSPQFPPELHLGLPGALPVIVPEERNSQYWGDGIRMVTSSSGSGKSESGSDTSRTGSGCGSGGRKEAWDARK